MPNPVLLFHSGGALRDALAEQLAGLRHEIESEPEHHILQADETAWTQALADRWRLELPELRTNDVWIDDPAPCDVDVAGDPRRAVMNRSAAIYVRGHRTAIHIPFLGDKGVFLRQPTMFTLNPPFGEVSDHELVFPVEYPDDSMPELQGLVSDLLRRLEPYVSSARSDIADHNAGLLNTAQMAIRNRKNRVAAHRAHIAGSGLQVGPPRDQNKKYLAEAIVRRPAPELPARRDKRLELQPVLADEIYEHILASIRQHALSMEKNPETYAHMGEEKRRHVILDMLNAHYQGVGTAEAFNFGGKTDIRIAHEGRNLFIAECKIWSGPKGFSETLDQLFSYQSWRDTKLAILMFVEAKGLTEIVEKARAALHEHPQFLKPGIDASETELRAVVKWAGDERREADLNVFLIATPPG
jgi:hypothetical protein